MRILAVVLLLALPLCAQTAAQGSVAGTGYRNASTFLEAAPGQVVIVSVNGAKARLNQRIQGTITSTGGLATTVGGFSAQLVQQRERTPAGIYGVSQSECPASPVACSPVTNITLQLPFDLVSTLNSDGAAAGLEIKEGDSVLAQLPVRAVSDKIHIITSCDESAVYYSVFGGEDLTACTAAVVRPRGGLITPNRPVRSGEPLVAF